MSSGWDQVVTHQPTITQYYNIAQPTITQYMYNQPTNNHPTMQTSNQAGTTQYNVRLYCILYIGDVSLDDVDTTIQPKPSARFDHLVMVTLPYKYSASVSFYL